MKVGDYVEIIEENDETSTRYVGKHGVISDIRLAGKSELFVVELDGTDEEGTCLARDVIPAEKPEEEEDGQS